jgi:outer membrane murein-binding lipoprotein Lpp
MIVMAMILAASRALVEERANLVGGGAGGSLSSEESRIFHRKNTMNIFLLVVVLAVTGGAYYMYTQNQTDESTITDLHHQMDDLNAKVTKAEADAAAATATAEAAKKALAAANALGVAGHRSKSNPSPGFPDVVVVAPDTSRSSAIDAAATAAAAASHSASLGTIKTLDGKTYTNCKVLKVEQDGVTFSHDDGITKILFPLLPPEVQKMFDYDPEKAVQQTDAQIRYDQQQAAASNAAPVAPAATTNQ